MCSSVWVRGMRKSIFCEFGHECETIHMKRTNLVLDEDVLREAQALSKKRTYSETVNEALREYCRLHKVSRIFDLADSNIWEGSLEDMREDAGEG